MQIFATAVGTVQSNRKYMDRTVTMKKEEEKQLKKSLGQLSLAHMCVWFMLHGLARDLCKVSLIIINATYLLENLQLIIGTQQKKESW